MSGGPGGVKIVVGLGNPGPRYERTRHNLGFMVVERLIGNEPTVWRPQCEGWVGIWQVCGSSVHVLKPATYMNRSGQSIRLAAARFGALPEEILIVHDEIDLSFGTIRLKVGGGVAGHNGLKSATQELGSPDYARLRVGIGRPGPEFDGSLIDYVLEAFPPGDEVELDRVLGVAAEALRQVIEDGFSVAMNRVNRRDN